MQQAHIVQGYMAVGSRVVVIAVVLEYSPSGTSEDNHMVLHLASACCTAAVGGSLDSSVATLEICQNHHMKARD